MTQAHEVTICKRLGGIHQRYSLHNWSDAFECPICGKQQRQSLNFLGGSNLLLCDGQGKFIKVPGRFTATFADHQNIKAKYGIDLFGLFSKVYGKVLE